MSFHVPNLWRVPPGGLMSLNGDLGTTDDYGNCGAFILPDHAAAGRRLLVIASDGEGWEHVSVTIHPRRKNIRCPNWPEMCMVKDYFWDEEDVVVQFHPRKSEYVNNHPGCLHLWRQVGATFPTPAKILVGIKGATAERAKL